MKVTVCFGDVRVLVPCGHGDLLVRDLVREATLRYKKATGKGPESWVVVRNLRSQTGGILDPDDRLQDVADDRETLVAALAGPSLPSLPPHPPHHHGGGDGASGSSVGTASPDIFRGGGGVGGSVRMDRKMEGADMCGVDVGAAELEGGTGGLQVRRGSEPTLNQDLLPHSQSQMSDHTKRWSAAVVGRDEVRLASPQKIHLSPDRHMENSHLIDSNKLHINSTNNHFQRQINRLSMQFSGPGSGIWLDAADRIPTNGTKSLPRESARKEPLGQDTNLVNGQNHRMEDTLTWVSGVNNNIRKSPIMERPLDMLPEVNGNEMSMEIPVGSGPVNFGHNNTNAHHKNGQVMTVDLVKGEKGLGFTITTRDNPTGGVCPIYIKNILPKGAAVVDGRLRAGDRLVAVAGRAIAGLTQQAVVAALRAAPTNSTVILVIERPSNNLIQAVQPQPSPPKFMDVKSTNSITITNKETNLNIVKPIVENGNRVNDMVNAINHNHNNSVRGRIKKSASRDDILNKELNDSDSALQDALNSSNTVLGLRNRMILRLDVPVHDSEKAGLGISVKGKVTVGPHPQDLGIFIKSVLHGGAASRDGRLHTNDQLLNVNGVSLVGQSNAEAMETLRRALVHTKSNIQGNISLTIARRTESMDSLSRWKDDTPPGVNESANSTNENISSNNSQSFSNQTVIYNSKISNKSADHTSGHQIKNHKSIVHLDSNYTPPNANSYYETAANDSNSSNNKKHSSVITINNNNSWISNQSDDNKALTDRDPGVPEKDNKRDSFEWGRLDGWNPVIDRLTSLRNESYYIATHTESPTSNGHREQPGRANHPASVYLGLRSPPQHNVILEEDYGSTKAPSTPGVWESESESVAGGDTGFSRTAIGRQSMSEKRHAALDARNTGTYKKLKEQRQNNGPQVGPALGMRKSSSLESLQTAIQEVSLHNKHNMLNMRRPDNFHSRAPLKHWLTDDHGGVDGMVRGSPQQSSLHHKKPSLLKSISTMFKIGKHKPKTLEASSEIYGRSQPMRSSEKSISKEALERIQHTSKLLQDERNNLESIRQNNHFKSGGTPEGNDRQWNAPPYRQPPLRTSPHTLSQVVDGGWGEHYSNYEEIQQNLNARREKLSEVQIGQMRRQVHAQRVKAEEETRRGPISKSASGHNLGNGGPGGNSGYHSQRGRSPPNARPQSNFYEYETVQRGRIRDPNINVNANTKLVQYR